MLRWMQFQNLHNDVFKQEIKDMRDEICDLYEEVSALSYQIERLKEGEDDLPRVSKSRGCIKIIL